MSMIQLAAVLAAVTLLVIGVLHVVWAATPWPLPSRRDLAVKVVGRTGGDLPPIFTPLTVLVGVLLVGAAGLTAARAGLLDVPGPEWLPAAGAWSVGAVLGLRGVAGLADSGLGVSEAPAAYRTLDVRYYSTLCLALAALVLAVAVAGA